MPKRKKAAAYGADQIKSLSDVDHVRLRPDMYIGSTDSDGLHHIFIEALDNAIDENIAGFTDRIVVTLNDEEGWIEVFDYGRGIPVAKSKDTGRPTVLMAVDTLKTGGKFGDGGVYQTSAGLHGVGVKATNFLSEWFEVEVSRDGKLHSARYERGVLKRQPSGKAGGGFKDLLSRRAPKGHTFRGRSGTRIRFKPDREIFDTVNFDPARIAELLIEASFTCPTCTFEFRHGDTVEEYHNPDGLMGRLHKLIEDEITSQDSHIEMQHDPVYISTDIEDGERTAAVEVAFAWTNGFDEYTRSYVNTKYVREGGTHETGLRRAVTTALSKFKGTSGLDTNDLRAGLFAVIHYKCNGPKFKGQTKDKLQTPEASRDVSGAVQAALAELFETDEDLLKFVIERAKSLKLARKRFKNMKAKLTEIESASKRRMPFPDKAALATSCKPEDRELFLVEGDSAGGTAKQARDSSFQEVLPLRGKVVNAEKGRPAQVLANKEIQAIAVMIGAGLDQVKTGDGCDPEKARVGKIMLLMDADSDGLHIATLVLTFLANYMLPMIRARKVFIVDSPLFLGTKGQKRVYGATVEEVLETLPGATITRFKGHGEADPEDLKTYAMAPTRKLIQVTERALIRAKALMGSDAEPRRVLLGLTKEPKTPAGWFRVNGEYRRLAKLEDDVKTAILDILRKRNDR